MLLIQGSGAVRPGQWARALCINESLKTGSIIPYLTRAISDGYGVIVFNPNQNYVIKETKKNKLDFLSTAKPIPMAGLTISKQPIPGNDSPVNHTLYVWDNFCEKTVASQLVIVAHSAGGYCTTNLLRERENRILPRLKAIAFTDSGVSVYKDESAAIVKFLKKFAINFVASSTPLDTKVPERGEACPSISSGHEKHENTSQSAIVSVFKLLNSHCK